MNLEERCLDLVQRVEALGYRCAVVGGIAVSVHARPRLTHDVDLAVAVVADAEAEALALALQQQGYVLLQVFEQADRGVLATLRFQHPLDPPDGPPTIDLLVGSTGIEPEVVAMKVLSERPGRPRDRDDLTHLLTVATEVELNDARALLALIHTRGFHRDKDLGAALAKCLAQREPDHEP